MKGRTEPGCTEVRITQRAAPAGELPVISRRAWTQIVRSLRLSGREHQILLGVFEDYTDRAIALSLGISPRTVRAHMERLHHKLGVRTRSRLVQRVMWEFVNLMATPGSNPGPIFAKRAAGGGPLAR